MRAVALLATIIATNITSAPREIGANYFDTLNQSQVWINVEPKNLEPGPNPIQLNATVSFPGRSLAAAPASVDLRVQAYCFAFLTRIRQPVFTMIVDGIEWKLDTPDQPLQVTNACGDNFGTADVAVARVGFTEFLAIATASNVIVHALGFHVQLAPTDLRAIASFARAVSTGVTVK
jgi:hypothetical protein